MPSTNTFHAYVPLNGELFFTIDGIDYCYIGDVDVTFTIADFGIGRYEYGDGVFHDSQVGVEEVWIEDFFHEGLHRDTDGSGGYDDTITADEKDAIKDKVLAAMNKVVDENFLRESCDVPDYED